MRIDSQIGTNDKLEVVREEAKISEKEVSDFMVTPNNKFVIVSGKDGQVRVFDYFMRGCNLAKQGSSIIA